MTAYQYARSAELILSGPEYFTQLHKIVSTAKESIHIQTYIFELDETGKSLLSELAKAVQRGVTVHLLADGYGSKNISNSDIKEICSLGIRFRLFSTFFSRESVYAGRRLHHKIAVADKKSALVGGINIADKYQGAAGEIPWFDYAVWVKGEVCEQLDQLCDSFFYKKVSPPPSLIPAPESGLRLRFIRNDWIRGYNQIHIAYLKSIHSAEKKITFVTSYFLPGYRFRKALKQARKKGVEIQLILAGQSDMPILFYAEKYFYRFFLQNGIKIYEWKNSVMHAKAMIVDSDWATVGSYNLNPLSRYLSIELNVEIKNRDFALGFEAHIDKIVENDCNEIQLPIPYEQNIFAKARNALTYYFFRMVFMLFVSRKR